MFVLVNRQWLRWFDRPAQVLHKKNVTTQEFTINIRYGKETNAATYSHEFQFYLYSILVLWDYILANKLRPVARRPRGPSNDSKC